MYYILTNDQPDHTHEIRFICLKMMEDWMFARWNTIDRTEKSTIRSGVMKLFDNQSISEGIPASRTKFELIFSPLT